MSTPALKFAIEGISEWAEKRYFPTAASLLGQEEIGALYVIDRSSSYSNKPDIGDLVRRRKIGLVRALANQIKDISVLDRLFFLDKADPVDLSFYHALNVQAVFIVTPPDCHAEIAAQWLGRTNQIFVEKPLAETINDPQLSAVDSSPDIIFNVDHYLLRASWLATFCDSDELLSSLGNLQHLHIRMIEKEIELKSRLSVQKGLILDMMPHLFALVQPFGELGSIDLHDLWAAQCAAAPPGYQHETFAKVTFTFDFQRGSVPTQLDGQIAIGKGLVPDLQDSLSGKYLELQGDKGSVVVNLEGDYAVRVLDTAKAEWQWHGDLLPDPYSALLREIANGSTFGNALLKYDTAKTILGLLERVRKPVPVGGLPSYSSGAEFSDVERMSFQSSIPP